MWVVCVFVGVCARACMPVGVGVGVGVGVWVLCLCGLYYSLFPHSQSIPPRQSLALPSSLPSSISSLSLSLSLSRSIDKKEINGREGGWEEGRAARRGRHARPFSVTAAGGSEREQCSKYSQAHRTGWYRKGPCRAPAGQCRVCQLCGVECTVRKCTRVQCTRFPRYQSAGVPGCRPLVVRRQVKASSVVRGGAPAAGE